MNAPIFLLPSLYWVSVLSFIFTTNLLVLSFLIADLCRWLTKLWNCLCSWTGVSLMWLVSNYCWVSRSGVLIWIYLESNWETLLIGLASLSEEKALSLLILCETISAFCLTRFMLWKNLDFSAWSIKVETFCMRCGTKSETKSV